MKPIYFAPLISLLLLVSFNANAADAKMRVSCDGDDVGAEVYVDGKFRGECPVDFKVPAGTLKLRVIKKIDVSRERVFEQEIRMAEDSAKKVDAVLNLQLTAEGRKLEQEAAEKKRVKLEAENEEKRRADDMTARKTARMWEELKNQGVEPGNGKSFRDCPDCPEMVLIPGAGSQPFALGKYEVTQAEWQAVMGNNPSKFRGANLPVEQVTWIYGEFLTKLNQKTGKKYRLPTAAEWEFACYGGSQTEYCGSNNINAVAWYEGNSGKGVFSSGQTKPVGQKQANGYGLYDMSGNVWELTSDEGSRGGSWSDDPQTASAANRNGHNIFNPNVDRGFRLARTLP